MNNNFRNASHPQGSSAWSSMKSHPTANAAMSSSDHSRSNNNHHNNTNNNNHDNNSNYLNKAIPRKQGATGAQTENFNRNQPQVNNQGSIACCNNNNTNSNNHHKSHHFQPTNQNSISNHSSSKTDHQHQRYFHNNQKEQQNHSTWNHKRSRGEDWNAATTTAASVHNINPMTDQNMTNAIPDCLVSSSSSVIPSNQPMKSCKEGKEPVHSQTPSVSTPTPTLTVPSNKPLSSYTEVKEQVDAYLNKIDKISWDKYEWRLKVVSQLPDFDRHYDTTFYDVPVAVEASLKFMANKKLEQCVPSNLLDYDESWFKKKMDVAKTVIKELEKILHEWDRKDQANMYDSDSDEDSDGYRQTNHYNYIDDIKDFFNALPYNLVFHAGFDALGIYTQEEEQCYCPCGWKMLTWQKQFFLYNGKKKAEFCSDKRFMPHALMFHLKTVGENNCNLNGLLHRGTEFYLRELYKDHNRGLGHKALYNIADSNYKQIEAYERRKSHQIIMELQGRLREEEKKRMESERLRIDIEKKLNEHGLQQLNQDKYDQMNAITKMFKEISLELKPKHKRSFEELMKAKSKVDNLFRSMRSVGMNKATTVSVHFPFQVQSLFDEWHRNPELDTLFLFNEIKEFAHLSKFLSDWNFELHFDFKAGEDKRKSKSRKEINEERRLKEDLKAIDQGGPTAQFFNEFWSQLGDLKVNSANLFEKSEGGLVPLPDENIMESAKGIDPVEVLKKAKLYYRAIGRLMLHSIMESKDEKIQKRFPIPTYAMPRFWRNIIMRGCGPENNDLYPWSEVISDLGDLGFSGMINYCIKENKDNKDVIFSQIIPSAVINTRRVALDGLKEGFTIGGVIDAIGAMLQSIPERIGTQLVFTKPQLTVFLEDSQPDDNVVPFFRFMDLDVLDSITFAKGSIKLSDVMAILRVKYWGWSESDKSCVPENIVNAQKGLFLQLGDILRECAEEENGFLTRFVEFFTGFSYLPAFEESELEFPEPDPKGEKFEIIVEFNGDESADPESLPVAHTCIKTMKLPGGAYGNNRNKFKAKLKASMNSLPRGVFDMN